MPTHPGHRLIALRKSASGRALRSPLAKQGSIVGTGRPASPSGFAGRSPGVARNAKTGTPLTFAAYSAAVSKLPADQSYLRFGTIRGLSPQANYQAYSDRLGERSRAIARWLGGGPHAESTIETASFDAAAGLPGPSPSSFAAGITTGGSGDNPTLSHGGSVDVNPTAADLAGWASVPAYDPALLGGDIPPPADQAGWFTFRTFATGGGIPLNSFPFGFGDLSGDTFNSDPWQGMAPAE